MNKLLAILFLISPIFIYAQCVSGDCTDGQGQYRYKNGTYSGDFLKGNLTGEGVFKNKKGYMYSGYWHNGARNGLGRESLKRGHIYEGEFVLNVKQGQGTAWLPGTKFMDEVIYVGQWVDDVICGKGELSYIRDVKYGRIKKREKNILKGLFVNGVYQGRLTEQYDDEITWSPFILKSSDFNNYKQISDNEYKKLKNPATIEGAIVLSCECISGAAIFEATSIFRKDLSWWAGSVPPTTKSTILNTRQREFDIIEWHARELEIELNKKNLECGNEAILTAWEALGLKERECSQVRKDYSSETAWNPKKGSIKNPAPQQKWSNRIEKKLEKTEKICQKLQSKIRKRLIKKDDVFCIKGSVDPNSLPQKTTSKQPILEEKKIRVPLELKFPRPNQLE